MIAKKRLFAVGAVLALSVGCESPFEPQLPVDLPSFAPSYDWLVGEGPTLLGVTNQGELVRINVSGGLGTVTLIGDAGQHPLLGHDLGWTGITYGPGGELYVTSRTNGDPRVEVCAPLVVNGSSACSHLYTIDPQNGAMLQDLGSFGVPYVADLGWGGDAWMGSLYFVTEANLDASVDFIGGGFANVTPDGPPPTTFTADASFGDLGEILVQGYNQLPASGGIAHHPNTSEWWGADSYDLPLIFRIDPATGKAIEGTGLPARLDNDDQLFGFSGMTITNDGDAFVVRTGAFELYAVNLADGSLTTVPLVVGPGISGKLTSVTEGALAQYTFESIDVTLAEVTFDQDQLPNADAFAIEGLLTLDPLSDGLDPVNEDVTIRVGSLLQTIPSGSFHRVPGQSLARYQGSAPGLTLVELRDDLTFRIEADDVSMAGADVTPQAFRIQVDNDEGETTALFSLIGQAPPRPTSLMLASTDRGEIVSLDLSAGTASVIGRVLQYAGREIGWTGLAFAPNGNLFVSTIIESGLSSDGCEGQFQFGSQCSHLFVVEADSGYVYKDLGSTGIAFLSDLTFESETLFGSHFMNDYVDWSGGLSTLDRVTGASSNLGRHGILDDWEVTNGGVAWDAETSTMWAVEDEFGAGRLLQLDPNSGAVISATTMTLGGSPIAFGLEGLEALPGGFLVAVRSEGSSDLYQINPNSGVVTPLGMDLPSLTGSITGLVFAEGINRTPKANAGPDQTHVRTAPGDFEVTLDGSLSFDPDGNSLAYRWSEDGVDFSTAVSPTISLGVGTHVLTLSVEDASGAIRTSEVTITIVNVAPVAVAGDDKTVATGSPVLLDGSGSSDLDGTIDSFEWLIDGAVQATGETASLTLSAGVYSITLRVTDNDGAEHEDVVEVTVADRIEVSLQAGKDAFLTPDGDKNRNEGANPYLGLDDGARIVVAFDLGDIDPQSVTSATLVFTPDPSYETDYWGASGGQIDAHVLLPDFPEGNAAHTYFDKRDEIDGRGRGVTWECRDDANIKNKKRNCSRGDRWGGGEFGSDATSSFLQLDDTYADLTFDVTADVLAGSASWLVKQPNDDDKSKKSKKSRKSKRSGKDEDYLGTLRVFSREGAPDPSFAPRLIIEYTPGG